MSTRLCFFSKVFFGLALSVGLPAEAQDTPSPVDAPAQPAPAVAPAPASAAAVESDAEPTGASIDNRFTTEGFVGIFGAGLQNSVPSLGLTASIFLDDDFRAGIDLWRGNSKPVFSSFKSQGAGVWAAQEMADSLWIKGGLSYSRLERPTSQQPLSALFGGKESSDRRSSRTDAMQLDVGVGQLWSLPHFSVAVDYVGFSFPFMILTGPKPSAFSLNALRVEILYDIE